MKGKINKIWENSLKDGRRYVTLDINGERYSCWDKKYFGGLKEGDIVDYEWKQSGKYKQITKINVDHELEPIAEEFRKDIEIVRLSCLKSAIYIIKDSYMHELDIEDRIELALKAARRFEKYVTDFGEGSQSPDNDEELLK